MKKIYSPLRYPGGKAKVLGFMKELVEKNFATKKPVYIEPYAGGAAVALGLLLEGFVSAVYINDFDDAIYSFWSCVKNYHEEFINKIKEIDVCIETWHKQVAIYKEGKVGFDLGFATFFLNRCNRSGVIKGGCIGGIKQEGAYKLGCRFNKENLIQRIEKIVQVKEKIHLYREDTLHLLQRKEMQSLLDNCLLYLDPPYYVKGHQLYQNHYQPNDHVRIANMMRELNGYWVVSYDNVPEIQQLYSGFRKEEFFLNYSAGARKKGKEIMFFSDAIRYIPEMTF